LFASLQIQSCPNLRREFAGNRGELRRDVKGKHDVVDDVKKEDEVEKKDNGSNDDGDGHTEN